MVPFCASMGMLHSRCTIGTMKQQQWGGMHNLTACVGASLLLEHMLDGKAK
jgi:hypothetical protein